MTHLTARVAVPNSLLLVLDPCVGELPDTMAGTAIAASPSGIALGTLLEIDGETEIHLTDAADIPVDSDLVVRWDGTRSTSGRLGVLTIYNNVLIEMDVGQKVRVRIWTNDATEPDVIWSAATS